MQEIDEQLEMPKTNKKLLILVPILGMGISLIFIIGERNIIGSSIKNLAYGAIITSGLWFGCMTIVGYLWKKYPWQHNPVKRLVIEFLLITVYTLCFSFTIYELSVTTGFTERVDENIFSEAVITLLITYFITTLNESAFFYKQWKYNFSKSVQLQNQHLNAKYESLKSQMNPHYVFNSLNNLVSIVDDNPLAVEYINQMSSYLRYMIKSRSEEIVPLDEELSMLKKYIYLHKIRFGEIFNVHIEIDKILTRRKIPPLTLQMLLENCIKHNIVSKNKPLTINIKGDDSEIIIENNRNPKNISESTGQGLSNIKERYKYFTNKEVIVTETESFFNVSVPLIED